MRRNVQYFHSFVEGIATLGIATTLLDRITNNQAGQRLLEKGGASDCGSETKIKAKEEKHKNKSS